MHSIEEIPDWVVKLIQEYGGIYATADGIELIVNPDDESFYLGCKYPCAFAKGSPDVQLEIFRKFPSIHEFNQVFSIEYLLDLDQLTPAKLLPLYGMGKMSMSAISSERGSEWCFHFRIESGITYIVDAETDQEICSTVALNTPEEIITFTREYINSRPPRLTARHADKIRREDYL